MAVQSQKPKLKLRIKYDKDSQTFSQCSPIADDHALYDVAMAIHGLRKDENVEITKIIESTLVKDNE